MKMARTKSVRGQGSDNEGEKKEEEQQVPKSDENKSSSSSTDSEERRQEIAEVKWPIVLDEKKKGPLGLNLDYNAVMLAWEALSGNKGVVIGKSQTEAADKPKASETKATVEPKAKRGRSRRSFAVNRNYYLRSKGMIVDETNADRKRKRKEEETDDYQGPVTDSEQVCKKTKKEPNSDDDDGTDDDDDGTVGGAHTNVPSAGSKIAAGN